MTDKPDHDQLLSHTVDIVSAFAGANTHLSPVALVEAINSVYSTLDALTTAGVPTKVEERPEPAVSIRSSIKPDYIVCLEDGKKLKMLKRHLMTHYQMTPDQYRTRWNLPSDYPMVAPNYAEQRRGLAIKIGLGRKAAIAPAPAPAAAKKPTKPAGRIRAPKAAPAPAIEAVTETA
jgi:predicted transcriptional regulator